MPLSLSLGLGLSARNTGGGYSAEIGMGAKLIIDYQGVKSGGAPYYWYNGTRYTSPANIPGWTFSRASTGYAEKADGTLVAFAANVPRITDKGLLVEGAATNTIRNSSMIGAVAGSPGTAPTNWSYGATAGLTRSIVGTGTDSATGLPYIDIRFAGTTSSTAGSTIFFETATSIAAINGQSWTNSAYIAVVGGSATNLHSIAYSVDLQTSGGAYISTLGANFSVNSTVQRVSGTVTLNQATVAFIRPYLLIAPVGSGLAVDITLRIFGPQTELGSQATSYIPTTTAAATRAADNASITGLGAILGQFRTNLLPYSQEQTQGTWLKTNVTVASAGAIGPNGDTAMRVTLVSGTNQKAINRAPFAYPAAGTTLTQSWFAKFDGGVRYVQIPLEASMFSSTRYANFDLQTGVVTQTSGTNISAQIVSLGDGWFRLSVTSTTDSTGSAGVGFLWAVPSGTSGFIASFAAAGSETLLVYGSQLETGPVATPYIPTTTAAVTVGNPFTMAVEVNLAAGDGVDRYTVSATDPTGGYATSLRRSGANGSRLGIVTPTSGVGVNAPGIFTGAVALKQSARIRATESAVATNGSAVVPVTVAGPSFVDRLQLGRYNGSTDVTLNGQIRKVVIYGDLTDAQLQAVTA